MNQQQVVQEIQQLKESLEEMEKRLATGEVPVAVLEDFKSAVDHIRNTVWALISGQPSDEYEISSHIARFRVKRTTQMLQQIIADIDTQELTIDAPEVLQLQPVLGNALQRLERFLKSGI